jgi:hypothetical protein
MDEPVWQPWTMQEVEALLDEDVAALSPDESASFTSVKVAVRPVTPKGGADDQPPTHWVVAERAGKVVYWDSVAEEFGVGRFRDGAITEQGNYGELQWALDELLAQIGRRADSDPGRTTGRQEWTGNARRSTEGPQRRRS